MIARGGSTLLLAPTGSNALLVGAGAGLVIPFMNLYFARRFDCSSAQIGSFFSAAQIVTAFASLLAPGIVQLHSSKYRNPPQLRDGPVLIVGAGNSGSEIAMELTRAGHKVWMSGRDTGHVPFRIERAAARFVLIPLVLRLLCAEARVDSHRMQTGFASREDWARLASALGLSRHPVALSESLHLGEERSGLGGIVRPHDLGEAEHRAGAMERRLQTGAQVYSGAEVLSRRCRVAEGGGGDAEEVGDRPQAVRPRGDDLVRVGRQSIAEQ